MKPHRIIIPILIILISLFSVNYSFADELEDVYKTIIEKQKEYYTASEHLKEIKKAQQELQTELDRLSGELSVAQEDFDRITSQINKVGAEIEQVAQQLADRKEKLAEKEFLRNQTVRSFYKNSQTVPLQFFLTESSFVEAAQTMVYHESVLKETKRMIEQLNQEIAQFEQDKAELEEVKAALEKQQAQLAAIRNQLASKKESIEAELEKNLADQSILGSRLAQLSEEISEAMARQQALAQQLKVNCEARQPTPNPAGAPSWRFYGHGTEHGIGMSQYGAYGMAKDGKSAREIMEFYYSGATVETRSSPARIKVSKGGQVLDLAFEEEYLAGIGEVPNNWPEEAIKAQIIAARSYAWSYAENYPNRTICSDASCQVYAGGQGKRGAADATRGQVLVHGHAERDGGGIATAYYFSTSGGHTDDIGDNPSFTFDSPSRTYSRRQDKQNAYPYLRRKDDQTWDSASPFNDWSGIMDCDTNQSNPPGSGYDGGTPISQPDMTDILNAALLKRAEDGGHLDALEVTTPSELVQEWLRAEGTEPIENVSSVALVKMGGTSDRVMWVAAQGANRNISEGEITGIRFRYVYNIRSPEKDWLYSTWFDIR